jgi:hypothetical protein
LSVVSSRAFVVVRVGWCQNRSDAAEIRILWTLW